MGLFKSLFGKKKAEEEKPLKCADPIPWDEWERMMHTDSWKDFENMPPDSIEIKERELSLWEEDYLMGDIDHDGDYSNNKHQWWEP